MKLHLPKILLTAVLAAVTLAPTWGEQVESISDAASSGDITYTEKGRLLYAPNDTDGTITFTGNIDMNGQEVWVGPGTTGAATTGQSTLVELSGIISNGGTLKLNEYSNGGGHAVYVLSNTANTFSGTVHLGHGGNANANVQLSLTANSLSAATVEFENKDKGILSVEANATILGLKGEATTSLVTSSSTSNTLTLSGSGEYTYAGKIGTGNYISRDNFSTTSTATSASTALNITKTGTGTQTFSGEANLGTVTVNAGKMKVTGNLTLNGNLTVGANGTFEITKAITNNGTITGALKIESLENFATEGEVYSGGENTGNGILGATYTIVSNGTQKSGVSVSFGGTTYTTTEDGQIQTGDNTIFRITNTTAGEKASTINAIDSVTKISMNNGTSLILDAIVADAISVNSGDTANLVLNSSSEDALSFNSISAAGATINVTKDAASTASELSLGSASHSIGSLTIGDGVTVSSTYAGGGTGFIPGSVTVNGGGTLKLANGHDALGYNTSSTASITAAGSSATKLAKVVLGDTASLTLTTKLNLNGYTEVSGDTLNSYGTKVTVTNKNNTIKNEFQIRQNVEFAVGSGAALTLEGALTTGADSGGAFTKSEGGDMTISGNINTTRTIKVTGGALNVNGTSNSLSRLESHAGTTNINANSTISGTLEGQGGAINYGAGTHSVDLIDMASGGDATGTLTLKKNTAEGKQVVVTAGTLWLRKAATLNIEEGATLKLAGDVISIKGTAGSETVKTSVSTANVDGKKYLLNGTDDKGGDAAAFTINNADITINSTAEVTVGNRIEGSSLTNENTGTVTVTNGYNNFSAINANKGNINIQWHDGGYDFQKELNAVTIGAGCVLGVHKKDDAITSTANEGTLTIATGGTAKFGEGAQLYSNLELSDGVKLTLDGALTMGSTLKLGEGIVLDKDTLASINALTAGSESITLFEGVDSLVLGTTTYRGEVAFSAHFAGVTNNDVYLGYDGQKVFAGIQSVPEPTTATLSLLALAGLAARRRRK